MDLQQMLEAVLAAEPYKMILSNPCRKDEQFRRIVINRLETAGRPRNIPRNRYSTRICLRKN